ncbi:ankyrin repeat domain-containing protein [Microbulbifer thermotolerans]|uniref:ankyrin repeat domain-containing protein n=1 Tax=Microbulbifer thermotolerans TaxID=252514 RepID=UPI00224AB14D|nr:ankyrin repeat domain-containing protein [Microbulbifer thermotolerans]MCX2833349.1 ankyrin repeat domain-containing protein [Microbulbifer thermotolerans]
MKYSLAVVALLLSACYFTGSVAKPVEGLNPELVNDNHPICTTVYNSVLEIHKSTNNWYFDQNTGMPGILNVREELPEKIEGRSVYFARHYNPGCGGACETYQLLLSNQEIPLNRSDERYITLVQESPPASTRGTTLVQSPEEVYFGLVETNEFLTLHQAKPEGYWEEACRIRLKPKSIDSISGLPADLILAIEQLKESQSAISRSEGNCGSSRTLDRWKYEFGNNLPLLLSRPWSLTEDGLFAEETYSKDLQGMRDWALMGIDNYDHMEAYEKHFTRLKDLLVRFYQEQFNWDAQKSNVVATDALQALVGASIRFYNYSPFVMEEERDIRKAILQGKGIDAIAFDYDAYRAGLQKLIGYPENLLTISVRNPSALKYLLDQGLEVDRRNAFGKTALMYAAQYNNIESVRALIEVGADVNAETYIPDDRCLYRIRTSGYTPLHYAARYASHDLIQLLLDAGALPYAKTELRYKKDDEKYPVDWLEENPVLEPGDIAALQKRLAMPSPEEAKKRSAKLNLEAERIYGEGDIGAAYRKLREAVQLDPDNYRALSNLSLVALRAGNHLQAVKAADQLIKSGVSDDMKAAAYFNFGITIEDYFKSDPQRWPLKLGTNRYYKEYLFDSLFMAQKLSPKGPRARKIIDYLKESANIDCDFSDEAYLSVSHSYDTRPIIGLGGYGQQRIALLSRGESAAEEICCTTDSRTGPKQKCTTRKESLKLGDYMLSLFFDQGFWLESEGYTPAYSVSVDGVACKQS